MAELEGTLQQIGGEFAQIFLPVRLHAESGQILQLLAELGIRFPDSLADNSTFTNSVNTLVGSIEGITSDLAAIIAAIEAENWEEVASKTLEVGQRIKDCIDAVGDLETTLSGMNFSADGITPTDLNEFLSEFVKNLVDYLLITYVESYSEETLAFFEFFGITERTEKNIGSLDPVFPEYTEKKLHLNKILEFFESPAEVARSLYGWGNADFDGESLLEKLNHIFNYLRLPTAYQATPTPNLSFFLFEMSPFLNPGPGELPGLQILIHEEISPATSYTLSEDNWELKFEISSQIEANAGLILFPSGNIKFTSGLTVDADAIVTFTFGGDGTPQVLIGEPGASRLEVDSIIATAGVGLTSDGTEAEGTFLIEGQLSQGKVVIKPGNPDGFLAKVLPPEGFTLDFDVLVGLNSERGFYFSGSGTLDFDIPLSISIGPIDILNLTIGISPGTETRLELGADIRTVLGPFTAVVENMGLNTQLTFPDDRQGNMGPINLAIGFKPPNGIGLSLDAGVVKGGGYLLLDFDAGMYAGALELDFEGLFGFTVIGIINTKFPDGSEGFSLLLLINVTFDTPITLGFNFFLSGIGGIIGFHRTMVTLAIQQGVKDGSIDNILFPENAIANITQIISDLEAIFPAKQDQFVLGIMARITWNTPAVLTVEAGLIIEFPNPVTIAIIGVIRCALPTPDEAIIELNVAFAGIIDFEEEILMFDASIFDSRILTITLEGDMALRISWGDKPDFLVSVGGFHPTYTPAPHLKLLAMRRMTVNILSGNPNLVLTAYFAVTTNTIQFGSSLSFSFTVSKFGVYGDFGFDVLIQFSPFRFIAAVRASVAVKLGSSTLFSIGLSFNLEGPTPWRAHGYGSFKVLFVKFKVEFDKTWGEKRETSLPGTSVLPLLLEELEKESNWDAKPNSTLPSTITLADREPEEGVVVVNPQGSLLVDQMVVPLDLTMEKFGNYQPEDISKVSITGVEIGGEDIDPDGISSLQNSFAPGAYKEMSDADRLSSPSYEPNNSGVKIDSTDEMEFDYGINRLVEYETILSDFEEEELGLNPVHPDFFKGFVSAGDVGKSFLSISLKNNQVKANKTISLAEEQYAVVSSADLSNVHAENKVFNSKSEADEYLRECLKTDPAQQGKIQLSPAFQLV